VSHHLRIVIPKKSDGAVPRGPVPEKWGFCFAGNEEAFCRALDVAAEAAYVEDATCPRTFVYYEIGIGNGDCLEAVRQYLRDTNVQAELFGVDLPDYSGTASGRYRECPASLAGIGLGESVIQLVLTGAEVFFKLCRQPADFIFIDACHGLPCVTQDFLAAEKLIRPGGVIAFHDTDPDCPGNHFQPHCGTGIAARAAVQGLGLLDGSRPGWTVLAETTGDKRKGGHGCLFVQRTKL